ncbi:unnamed protein product [Diabrotica balteata]|uniref:Uncharacterized protein n=1 Tax=Diabrotica balteata TaxID=107213 RepID=A0A9N9T3J7_DIABA|nr:unnamed protein product [Diabrotica balteata]
MITRISMCLDVLNLLYSFIMKQVDKFVKLFVRGVTPLSSEISSRRFANTRGWHLLAMLLLRL